MRWELFGGGYWSARLASFVMEGNKYSVGARDLKKGPRGLQAARTFGGVELRAELTEYREDNMVEWVTYLKNTGKRNSPTLSRIRAADVGFEAERSERLVHAGINGDRCSAENFMPFETLLYPGIQKRITPSGGRPSNGEFPFFDVRGRDGGIIAAIGWTGQWLYELERTQTQLELRIGIEDAEFYLKPGEEVRLDRVLFMGYTGTAEEGHIAFRRCMMKYHAPHTPQGDPVTLPCALQDFDRYAFSRPDWGSEQGQDRWIDCALKLGKVDTVWLDAAWFKGMFPYGVGNYSFRPGFPNGLRPNSDKVRKNGMKYMLWFEPERICKGSDVEEEHPEWVIFLPEDKPCDINAARRNPDVWKTLPCGLFDLGQPGAEEYLAEKLIAFFRKEGIDVYRQDYNIDPLPYWRLRDEAGRKGITEIRCVTAFYQLWDDLRAACPGLLIDNCASGGRRIDLETISRSVPLWRSDTGCSPIREDAPGDIWNQCQSMALSGYLPFHAIAAWESGAYEFRSAATNGIACQFDVLNEGFDFDAARKCLDEFNELRGYWKGDFRALTGITLDPGAWAAWQLDVPEKGMGVVTVFRRAKSPYSEATFELTGIDGSARYELVLRGEDRSVSRCIVSGSELKHLTVRLENRRASTVIEYRKVG